MKRIVTEPKFRILNLTLLLLLPAFSFAQDLIYLTNLTAVECDLDTTTIGKEVVKFRRFDQDGDFQMRSERIVFIKSYEGEILYPKEVIGNRRSKIFHWPLANHLPEKVEQVRFEAMKEAYAQGYKACIACMDFSPVIPDYLIERGLAGASRRQFESTHEILYEHTQLISLRDLLQDVLKGWPEPLRGYDYRIQVYKDPAPNALSIAAGNIYFSTSMVDMLEGRDEVRAVLAHEISHVERRHALREYYYRQNKQWMVLLGGLFAGTATYLLGGNADDVSRMANITSTLANFAVNLAALGYSRELEEEADVFAQLYFRQRGFDRKLLLSAFDKLAFHGIVRGSFNLEAGALSTHPALRERLWQLQNATLGLPATKLEFKGTRRENQANVQAVLSIAVRYYYQVPSSSDPSDDIVYLVGNLTNYDLKTTLKLGGLKIRPAMAGDKVAFEGLDDIVIYRGQSREFIAYAKMPRSKASLIVNQLRSAVDAEVNLDAAELSIARKGTQQPTGYRSIDLKFTAAGK